MYYWYNCIPKISQTVHYTDWTLLAWAEERRGPRSREPPFPSVQAVPKSRDPQFRLLKASATLPRAHSRRLAHRNERPWAMLRTPLSTAPGSHTSPNDRKAQCSNVTVQKKEGQYSLCMLYDNECLQSPSPKTKTDTGVGSIPLCRLINFAKCFLDCFKVFQDFKRCIRLSLQI